MYYLNAFNEMLRKRERQNMMGGGQDQGVGTAAPSGPMGLGPAQDRNAFRDFYTGMSPLGRTAMGMMPVIGPAFNVGRLVDSGISAYQSSQLAPSRDARERSQDQFRAFEIAGRNASEYGPAPTGTIDPGAYEGGFYGPQAFNENALNMGGGPGAPNFDANAAFVEASRAAYNAAPIGIVGEPISSVPTGESLAPMAGGNNNTGVFDARTSGESATVDTGNPFGGDAYGGSYQFAKGGMVHAEHLKGRAPAPDDGYGALQGGEYVITKAAVEKYGKRLLDAINNGTFR